MNVIESNDIDFKIEQSNEAPDIYIRGEKCEVVALSYVYFTKTAQPGSKLLSATLFYKGKPYNLYYDFVRGDGYCQEAKDGSNL